MKTKTLVLLLGLLFVLPPQSDAQFRKWVRNHTRRIQKTEIAKKVERKVRQIDPKAVLMKKINQNYQLSGYLNNINYEISRIKSVIKDRTTLYFNTKIKFQDNFYTTKTPDKRLVYLNDGGINKKYPYIIHYNNSKYSLYWKNNLMVALSSDQVPLDGNLKNIINAAYWSYEIKNLNPNYIANLQSLAKSDGQFVSYMLMFCNGGIDIINKLDNMSYAGITATTLIDESLKLSGYDFSISGIESTLTSQRDELKEMLDISNRIEKNSYIILNTRRDLINSRNVSYNDAENSLNSLESISKDINTLADKIDKEKQGIVNTRQNLAQLSSFSGISFIENIGDLFKRLENFYTSLENGVRNQANNFDKLAQNINSGSNQLYQNSKLTFDNITNSQIKDQFPYINDYLLLQQNISGSRFKNISQNNYVQYLNEISADNAEIEKAKNIDFIQFYDAEKKLNKLYNNFPKKNAENYYLSALNNIDKKQIIGGNFYKKYSKNYKAVVALVSTDNSMIKELVKANRNLDIYYNQAKTNNLIALGVLIAIIISIVTTLILISRKKKLVKVDK